MLAKDAIFHLLCITVEGERLPDALRESAYIVDHVRLSIKGDSLRLSRRRHVGSETFERPRVSISLYSRHGLTAWLLTQIRPLQKDGLIYLSFQTEIAGLCSEAILKSRVPYVLMTDIDSPVGWTDQYLISGAKRRYAATPAVVKHWEGRNVVPVEILPGPDVLRKQFQACLTSNANPHEVIKQDQSGDHHNVPLLYKTQTLTFRTSL